MGRSTKVFSLLVAYDSTAWELNSAMSMDVTRFGEYSGTEVKAVDVDDPDSLKLLERVPTLLMYETGAEDHRGVVRVGKVKRLRREGKSLLFAFRETGRLSQGQVEELAHRLQIHPWEFTRTHWAVKDGEIPQDVLAQIESSGQQYDIVLSFAGEDRAYVEKVAAHLEGHDVAVFYDNYELATLWGKDLVEHLDLVYRKLGRFCVMFVSKHYAEKLWTSHERRSALARAFEQRTEYILPARFDDTELPGLRPTVGYADLRVLAPEQLGDLIIRKLDRYV